MLQKMKNLDKIMMINVVITAIMNAILLIMCSASVFVLSKMNLSEDVNQVIDWSKKYPFANAVDNAGYTDNNGMILKIKNFVSMIEDAVGDSMILNDTFAYAGNWLETKIGWDADCVTAYNPTYRLDGNYIVSIKLTAMKMI